MSQTRLAADPAARWRALSLATQYRIACRLAKRQAEHWIRDFENVVSVGAGFRLRGEIGATELVREVCLCFLVKRKWRDERQRAQKLPREVLSFVTLRGRRCRVAIPTDVAPFSGGAPQALELTDGIEVMRQQQVIDQASACCVVRDLEKPALRYGLTCCHAFDTDLAPQLPPADFLSARRAGGPLLGRLRAAAPTSGSDAQDSAVFLLDDANEDAFSHWGRRIGSRASSGDLIRLHERTDLELLARRTIPASHATAGGTRQAPERAIFRSRQFGSMSFDYGQGRSFVFRDLIEYGANTFPGDSGSPLVDSTGRLWGMHFYRSAAGLCYAFTAPRMFDGNVFGFFADL